MDSDLRDILRAYLAAHNTMTLATCGTEGPAAAALFYVSDPQLRIFFLSEPGTRHATHLKDNPLCAATIHEDYRDWREIQGVQIRGHARPISDLREKASALRLYMTKYPFLRALLSEINGAGALMSKKFVNSQFYVLEPGWFRWIDNRAGFGTRREFDVLANQEITRGK